MKNWVSLQHSQFCAMGRNSGGGTGLSDSLVNNLHDLKKFSELPTVTFWPYFDMVTLKMYGNTVC